MFNFVQNSIENEMIKVIGIDGGGNTINYMFNVSLSCVNFNCVNTDVQALQNAYSKTII